MGDDPVRWWKLLLLFLRLLVVGMLGGVGTVFLVLYTLRLYVETFDSKEAGGYSDPMAGLGAFYHLVVWSFLIGACLVITADIAVRRLRHRRNH